MNGNRPDKKRKLGLGGVFLIILIGILVALFVSNNTIGLRGPSDNAVAADCMSRLHRIGNLLVRANENDSEAMKGATIPDVLREAAHSGELDEKCLHCPADGAPYHVFSVPAMLVFQRSEDAAPIPIVMDLPGEHGEERGSMVLYSDGTVRRLTTEEAEKLVAEQSPVPLKLQKNDDRTGQEEQKP